MSRQAEQIWRGGSLLWGVYILLWPPLLLLATYRSFEPAVLGLWSRRLFLVIAAYGAFLLAATLALALVCLRKKRHEGPSWITKLVRHNRVTLVLALVLPILAWLLLICGVIVIRPAAELSGRVSLALVDLTLLTVFLEAYFLLADRTTQQRRAVLVRLCAVGMGVLFSVAVIEIIGGMLRIEPLQRCSVNPTNLDVRWKNVEFDIRIRTNDQGLREPQHIEADHPGVFRVVVVGDSMTFGHGVNDDQVYPRLTQQLLLQEHGRKNVQIVNVSRQGAGPREYLHFLRNCVGQFKPDLIVLGFYTGNDNPVMQPYIPRTAQQRETLYQEIASDDRPHFLMRSVICRLMYRRVLLPLSQAMQGATMSNTPGKPDPVFASPNPLGRLQVTGALDKEGQRRWKMLDRLGLIEKGLNYEINPGLLIPVIKRPRVIADMMLLRDETRSDMLAEWELCRRVLKLIVAEANRLDAPLMLIAIPHAYQVEPKAVQQLAQWECFTTPEMLTGRRLNDLVIEFCRQEDVTFLDPLETFRKRTAEGEQLFLPIDSHFTPAGQRLLAEMLAERLAKEIPAD